MIEELEVVVLTEDLPEHGLKAGDIGTAVLVHGFYEGYEVEFVALDGNTIAVVSVCPSQIRAIEEGETAHIRRIKSA